MPISKSQTSANLERMTFDIQQARATVMTTILAIEHQGVNCHVATALRMSALAPLDRAYTVSRLTLGKDAPRDRPPASRTRVHASARRTRR